MFLLGNSVISWSSKKQTCIALSMMEAEFVALSVTVQEGVWLKRFVDHLRVTPSSNILTIFTDSQASISYSKDPKFHSKAKHIDIKYHYVKDMVAQGGVNLKYIPTHEMIADPLTKVVNRETFDRHVKSLGLRRL